MLAQKRERYQPEHHGHQDDAHQDDFAQAVMEKADAEHQRGAEHQLQPSGVGDAAGHLIGDEDHAERVQSGSGGIQRQQPADLHEARAKDHSHDQVWKQAGNQDEGDGNAEYQQQRQADAVGFAMLFLGGRSHGKHGIDYAEPRGKVEQPANLGDGGVDAGRIRRKEMLDQQNVDVIDDHLANKKNDGLHRLSEGGRRGG